jgi:neutral ceramidase
MKAGFSKLVITPELGTLMEGHPGTKKAQGVRDNLYVRVAAIGYEVEILVFASLDVLFVETESVQYIKRTVAQKAGIKPDNIFISATHTHSGPMTTGLFGKDQESGYIGFMHSQTIEAIIKAINNMQECSMGFGRTDVKGFAFNARFIMNNGKIETHPFKFNKSIVQPEGPVDDSLSFLYFYNTDSELMGGIINYANHPQVMERQNACISADFPGEMERGIVNRQGYEAIILFLNGTCGNICPVNAMDTSKCEVGEKWLTYMGACLAEKANSLLLNRSMIKSIGLKCISKEVELKIREIPEDLVRQATEFLKHHNEEDKLLVSNYGVEEEGTEFLSLEEYINTNEWLVQQYTDILLLKKIRDRSSTQRIMLSVLEIGGIAVVLLPFEVFVEFGLEIKGRSPYKDTIVAELTNGSYGYIPTEKAFEREGGYETITLRSSRFEKASGRIIVDTVISMLYELQSQNL